MELDNPTEIVGIMLAYPKAQRTKVVPRGSRSGTPRSLRKPKPASTNKHHGKCRCDLAEQLRCSSHTRLQIKDKDEIL